MTSLSTYSTLSTDTCDSSDNQQEGKLNPKLDYEEQRKERCSVCSAVAQRQEASAAPSVQEQVSCMLFSSGQSDAERVYLDTTTGIKN